MVHNQHRLAVMMKEENTQYVESVERKQRKEQRRARILERRANASGTKAGTVPHPPSQHQPHRRVDSPRNRRRSSIIKGKRRR